MNHEQRVNKKQKLPTTCQWGTRHSNRQCCLKRRQREVLEICWLPLAASRGSTVYFNFSFLV